MANTNYGVIFNKASALVGAVTNIDFPEILTEKAESTSHSSAGWREYIPNGLLEVGAFGVTLNVTSATISGVMADMIDHSVDTYTIKFPGTVIADWSFDAFPVSVKLDSADSQSPDVFSCVVEFQPTSDVAY